MDTTVTSRAVDYRARLARVRTELTSEGWGAVLVLDATDIAYLTGLHSSNAALVVTEGDAVIATDFRYITKAGAIPGATVYQVDQGLYLELGRMLGEWSGGGAVAYSPVALSHRAFLQLTEDLHSGTTLRAVEGIVDRLRRVKDGAEIEAIRNSAALLEEAYELVAATGLVGRRERDVAWEIERLLRDRGAEGMSFPSIVAAGTNGALPHHSTGNDLIPADTLVTIDIGCVLDGYCSDCTRTFATGPLDETLARIYEVTLAAQLKSLAAVRAGATGRDVDAIARDIIDEAGFGERFGHGLGHGVGLEVHEGPRLARTSSDVLEPGMIVTVEPGIYLPGIGGVRIEDLVVVTEGEPEVLTNYTKQLVQV